jgi:hypothetical protein
VRTDQSIDFDWGNAPPDPALPATYYSVRWQGNFTFTGGDYKFTLGSDDGSILYIDGQVVQNNWGEHAYWPLTVTRTLTPGTHTIRFDYYQIAGRAKATLAWTKLTPLATLTSPQNGSTVSGLITLSAAAGPGLSGIQFKVDGANRGPELTAPPYSTPLDTTTLTNGTHRISAMARNSAGSTEETPAVTIVVQNSTAPPPTSSCDTPGRSPDPAIPSTYFSARWQGTFTFTGGEYTFTLGSDDGSVLYIDGEIVYNNWGEHAYWPLTVKKTLSPGSHVIRFDYYQTAGRARASLAWSPGN